MNICPECTQGKHPNCSGDAWDLDRDEPTVCDCYRNNHEGDA